MAKTLVTKYENISAGTSRVPKDPAQHLRLHLWPSLEIISTSLRGELKWFTTLRNPQRCSHLTLY